MLEDGGRARAGAPAPEHLHAAHHELAGPPAALSLEVRLVQIRENAADLLDHANEVIDLDLKGHEPVSGVIRHDSPTGQRRPLRTARCPCFVLLGDALDNIRTGLRRNLAKPRVGRAHLLSECYRQVRELDVRPLG
jgi:hypothetical protein